MLDRIAFAGFLLGLIVVFFLGGYFVRARQVWPHEPIEHANSAFESFWQLNVEGFSFERETPIVGSGVTTVDHGRIAPGPTFLVLYRPEGFGAQLVDADGAVLHRWNKTFEEVWPDGAPHITAFGTVREIEWHGAHLFPNGDVLFNFEGGMFPYGGGLVRIDKDSNVVFKLERNTHHSVTVAEDGSIWVPSLRWSSDPPGWADAAKPAYYEDTILHLAPDGRVLKEISIVQALESLRALLRGRTPSDDPTHLNDIEVASPELARVFPMLEPGHLLVSLRNLEALVAIDPEREEATWALSGPFIQQHDPDLLPDGTILVFDNKGGSLAGEVSRVLQIDPKSGRIVWQFAGTEEEPLWSEAWAAQQPLPNGNVLITESYRGRALEVTREAEPRVVWEYVNRLPGSSGVGILAHAERFPQGALTFLDIPQTTVSR